MDLPGDRFGGGGFGIDAKIKSLPIAAVRYPFDPGVFNRPHGPGMAERIENGGRLPFVIMAFQAVDKGRGSKKGIHLGEAWSGCDGRPKFVRNLQPEEFVNANEASSEELVK